VWSDTDTRYTGVPIVFVDTEVSNWPWAPISKSYYWQRFFSHQPDANYDNPAVFEAIWEVMRFWLDLGVDSFRLDAVAFLVEREGTLCENLPETHAIIREFRKRLDISESLIPVRTAFRAFSRGSLQFLDPANPRVLAYTLQFGEEIWW
jgi:maltose alpha-D-glucosyltransferase/alpha-amylase